MTTKEEKVHQVFERISGQYDKMNSIISFQRHKAWRRRVMEWMRLQPGDAALDVCCGTADWTLSLADACGQNGRVVGLDFSENMLDIGREKVRDEALPQVELIVGNAMELPFADDSFEAVTIGFGLRNVPDMDQVIQEMQRVLKPGGEAVCLETSQPEVPGYKQVYNMYFQRVMPLLGRMFAKSYDEYAWLQESTMSFPDKDALKARFEAGGFQNVWYTSFAGGAAAAHFAYKPEV
ncbi:demethylmenaquinone methyltransferase [Salsuginibacillus halophilus]|uniref:demethylmenaquinone methyltransferase n=1 Tax=Salsuginibacillus halophilus TaxID=517424 RepID=UPI001FE4E895|nr:demethylmenaquinone methyltransferase [Salsuginibacillus halophilus]